MNSQTSGRPPAPGPLVAALLCLGAAVCMDPGLLAPVFSPDGQIGNPAVVTAIRICQALAVVSGLALFGFRQRIPGALFRRVAIRVIMVALAIALTCGAAELFVRLYHPHPLKPDETHLLFRHHDALGHAFIPGKEAIACAPYQFIQKIKINAHGMRDVETSRKKPDDVKRIATVGDSFTAGLEVKPHQVFTEVMERELGAGWEVLNFGVPGYSTLHEYLYLRDSILDFDPDIVLLVFYLRNDLDEMQGHYYNERRNGPLADLDDNGSLTIKNIPVPKPAGLLRDEAPRPFFQITDSHLFNFIHLRLKVREKILVNSYPEVRHFNPALTPRLDKDYRLLDALMGEFSELCRSRNIPLVLVYAPTIVQVYPDDYWVPVQRSQNLPGDYDVSMPNMRVRKIAEQREIPFLDLTPGLRERSERGTPLYFTWNQHWNQHGHQAVANDILSLLSDIDLAP